MNTAESAPLPASPSMNTFEVLVRRWKLVVGALVVVTAVVAAYVFLLAPPRYEARAAITTVDVRVETAVETRMRLKERESAPEMRIRALLAMVRLPAIVARVAERVSSQSAARPITAEMLVEQSETKLEGDIIFLVITDRDPKVAALIANTWSQVYEEQVNLICASSPRGQSEVQSSNAKKAREAYREAQGGYTDFLGRKRADVLKRDLDLELRGLEEKGRMLQRMEMLGDDLQTLRAEISGARPGPGVSTLATGLAWISLKSKALTTASGAPVPLGIELSMAADQPAAGRLTELPTVQELDAFREILKGRRQVLKEALEESSTVQRIRTLEVNVEREMAEERELLERRNTAWEAFGVISRKAAEEELLSAERVQVARIPAAIPTTPVQARKALTLAFSALLGLVSGVALAFVAEAGALRGKSPA